MTSVAHTSKGTAFLELDQLFECGILQRINDSFCLVVEA